MDALGAVKWFRKRILYFFFKKNKMRFLNRPPSFCI
jgi:hypothetical protein